MTDSKSLYARIWDSVANRRLTSWTLAAALGFSLAVLAWGPGRSAMLAAIVPLVVALAATRTQAFLIGAFYVLGVGRERPELISAWYDSNIYVGLGFVALVASLGGLGWALCWSSSEKPWRKALACVVGWVAVLVPPIGALAPGNPIVGWGYITPGWAWAGVAMSVIAPAAVMWEVTRRNEKRRHSAIWVSCLGGVLVAASFTYVPVESRFVADIVGVNTNWGVSRDPYEIINRVERIGRTTKALADQNLASAIVFPESILQTYEPALFPVLNIEVLSDAAKAGQTIVLGVDLPTKEGNFQNAALAFYPDGKTATAVARQPVPVALWKPWETSGSFLTDWTANNMLTLRDGIRARVIFCYEEYFPILSLINEAKDEHQLVIVMTNLWAAKHQLSFDIQGRHSEGMSRLFARKLIRAENRSKDMPH